MQSFGRAATMTSSISPLLVLWALLWSRAACGALASTQGQTAESSSSDEPADFSRGLLSRSNYECPAVCSACPACPAHQGCPAQPECPACPSAPPCPQRIPPGYNYYPGLGYYKMHYEKKEWEEAKGACEREGGYLAVLNSQSEADLASSFMNMHGFSNLFYIGFFDVTQTGKYVTVLGEPLSSTGYAVWAPGEPSSVGVQLCGALLPNKGFDDTTCSVKRPFLCELFT